MSVWKYRNVEMSDGKRERVSVGGCEDAPAHARVDADGRG